MKKQQLTLPLLFEARQIFFDGKIEKNRERSNVIKRMAFCNVFIKHAKKVDVAATIGKNHATVIHYGKQHEWHSKYCNEYISHYTVAEALLSQYLKEDEDYGSLNRFSMVSMIKDLRHTITSKQAEINLLNQKIEELENFKKQIEESKWNIKTYSAL